jgi:tryptophan 2,3-dioxygenase
VAEKRLAGSYGSYLRVPQLLSLQQTLSDPPHHDETLFIIIHQVYELWFKQMLHEVDAVIRCLEAGDTRLATRLARRLIEIQRVLLQQIPVLETMTPPDFMQFRDHLNPASGFQSYQFRALEFRSGLKEPRFLDLHRQVPEALAMLRQALDSPSLRDAWEAQLRARGLDYPEIAPEIPDAEPPAAREKKTEARMRSLLKVYSGQDSLYDLYILAEALIEYDENFLLWRQHHVLMVERMIGMKAGTGGSEGVGYLRTTLGRKCFPDLWAVRTHISGGGTYGS